MPRLKQAQRWILNHILQQLSLTRPRTAFVRAIPSSATPLFMRGWRGCQFRPHDFFPSIHFRRVKGVFRAMGYSEAVATTLALLYRADEEAVNLTCKLFHRTGRADVAAGAPTARLSLTCSVAASTAAEQIATKLGYGYTRYADDMSFSSPSVGLREVGTLLRRVRFIVSDEGFVLHPDKLRVMHRSQRQEVTGLVVNQRPAVSRRTLKRFRALLYQIEKDGPEGKCWALPAMS
ncbi:MAG: reverse transcriptase family protein [Candidatus Competibacteraceae bacterium]